MLAEYIEIFRITGANQLPDGLKQIAIPTPKNANLTALLTSEAHDFFGAIDMSAAIASTALRRVFNGQQGKFVDLLTEVVGQRSAERANKKGVGIYLVVKGGVDVGDANLENVQADGQIRFGIDIIDKAAVRRNFKPAVHDVLAALGLSMPPNADRRVQRLGDAVYLVDGNNQIPIYSLTFTMGATGSIGVPLTRTALDEVGLISERLSKSPLEKAIGLLTISFFEQTDDLHRFIAAWAALEIFVSSTFKSHYNESWTQVMMEGAPDSVRPMINRLNDVMRDKYRIADKFLIVASMLDTSSAEADHEKFKRLKDSRDRLMHQAEITLRPLPTDSVRELLQKYMRLHLLKSENQ